MNYQKVIETARKTIYTLSTPEEKLELRSLIHQAEEALGKINTMNMQIKLYHKMASDVK